MDYKCHIFFFKYCKKPAENYDFAKSKIWIIIDWGKKKKIFCVRPLPSPPPLLVVGPLKIKMRVIYRNKQMPWEDQKRNKTAKIRKIFCRMNFTDLLKNWCTKLKLREIYFLREIFRITNQSTILFGEAAKSPAIKDERSLFED